MQLDLTNSGIQIAVIAAVATVAAAFITLLGAVANLLTERFNRRYERENKHIERKQDKRAADSEVLVGKVTEFHRKAFELLSEVHRMHDTLINELFLQAAAVQANIDFDHIKTRNVVQQEAQLKAQELHRRVSNDRSEVISWLTYDAFRYWTWFEKPQLIMENILKIAQWHDGFYGELSKQVMALLGLYSNFPVSREDLVDTESIYKKNLEVHHEQLEQLKRSRLDLLVSMADLQQSLQKNLA